MSKKSVNRVRRNHSHEFRVNAISLVEDLGYTVAQAARDLGINQTLLRTWRKKYGNHSEGFMSEMDQEEMERLRKKVGHLRMERDWNAPDEVPHSTPAVRASSTIKQTISNRLRDRRSRRASLDKRVAAITLPP